MSVADTIARFVATLRAARQDDEALYGLSLEWPDEVSESASRLVNAHLPWTEANDGSSTLDTAAFRDLFQAVLVETGESFAPGTDIRRRAISIYNLLAEAGGRGLCTRTGNYAAVRWLCALVLAVLERDRDQLVDHYAQEARAERYAEALSEARLGGASAGDAMLIAQWAAGPRTPGGHA